MLVRGQLTCLVLYNKHLFLIVLESGKSNIKVLPDLVSGKGNISDLQRVTFSLCLHLVKRENFGLFLFL